MHQILALLFLFALSACGVTPAAHKEVVIKNSQPVATFNTSKAQREYARNRGLPVLLSGRAAQYPPGLDANNYGNGWVLLGIEVLATGLVGDVHVIEQSDVVFNDAAISAVRQWRFEPAQESARLVQRITLVGTRGDHLHPGATDTQ